MTLPPIWNAEGLLPPIDSSNPTSRSRSPYSIRLIDLIERFGTSPQRCDILKGFLEYRSFLHGLGISEGFQWVDGSFVEDKERRNGAAPEDIDVVTYFKPPGSLTRSSLNDEQTNLLFVPEATKQRFRVDGLIMPFGEPSTEDFIQETAYWHGLFSHTRTGVWKGFLQIPLAAGEDSEAIEYLQRIRSAS